MKKLRRIISLGWLGLGWLGLLAGLSPQTVEVWASEPPALEVRELRLESSAGHKRLNWRFSTAPSEVRAFGLSDPPRLVIDVSGPTRGTRSASYTTHDETVWRIRQGAHPQRLRFVLDFKTDSLPRYTIAHDGTRLSALIQTPGDARQASRQLFPPLQTASGQAAPATHADPPARPQPPTPTASGEAPPAAAGLYLHELQLGLEDDRQALSFVFSQSPHSVRSFALSDPPRLVLDVTGPVAPGPSARYTARDALVSAVRVGSHPDRLRFVVDLSGTRIPPFEVRQQESRLRLVFAQSPAEGVQAQVAQVLFRRPGSTALAVRTPTAPSSAPAVAEAPALAQPSQETPPTRRAFVPVVPAPPEEDDDEKNILPSWAHQLWEERIDGVAFIKNETAFRLYSPRQFSKAQNWLEVDVDFELSDWMTLTTIGRALIDPANHLESNTHDFAAGPIDRWASGDFFQAELRELYLEIVQGDFDLRLGRQQVVWGESLGLRILDVINPQDFREFILDDFIDARIPLWGARLDYTFDDWVFEGVWFLDFEDNRPADLGSEWQFRESGQLDLFLQSPAVQLAKTKKPQDGRLSDSEVGLRVTRFLRNMDLSLNYFYAWSDFPVGFRRTIGGNRFLVEPRHTRFHLLGGTFNYAFDVFVIRGEGGLKLGQHFISTDPRDADGVRQREFLSYVLGLDWTVNDNLMANFQFFQNVIFNKPKDIPDEAVNNIVSVFLRADFINETLFPELIALYGINFGELLIRPQIEYQLTDYLSVTLGADFFIGPRSGFFGQYAAPARRLRRGYFTGRNGRVFLEVKRSFALGG